MGVSITKFLGVDNSVAATEIDDNRATDTRNMVLDDEYNAVATRAGCAKLNSEEIVAESPILGVLSFSDDYVLAASGTKLAYAAEDEFTLCNTDLTAGGDYYGFELNGLLAILNGKDAPRKWTGPGEHSALGGSPPIAKYGLVHRSYALLMHTFENDAWRGSRVRASAVDNPESWPTETDSHVDINPDDGDVITGAVGVFGGVRIFKGRSQHFLSGDKPAVWSVVPVDCPEGAVSWRSVVVHDNVLYWIGKKGIYADNGAGFRRIHSRVQATVDTFNQAQMGKCWAAAWGDIVLFGVPTGSSTTIDTILVYYPRLGEWMIWDGWALGMVAAVPTSSGMKLYGGHNANSYVYNLLTGTNDDGAAINSYWQSKAFSESNEKQSNLHRPKWWRYIDLTVKATATSKNLSVQNSINGRLFSTAKTFDMQDANESTKRKRLWLPLNAADKTWGEHMMVKVGASDIDNPFTLYELVVAGEVRAAR